MWTRPQIKDFKEKIRQDVDSVITVGRGEVVTVRVPTHEEGSYLFWEFATDYYDIGFGVFFEWTDSTNASVSVHVSESSDEDEDEEGEECMHDMIHDLYYVGYRPIFCYTLSSHSFPTFLWTDYYSSSRFQVVLFGHSPS